MKKFFGTSRFLWLIEINCNNISLALKVWIGRTPVWNWHITSKKMHVLFLVSKNMNFCINIFKDNFKRIYMKELNFCVLKNDAFFNVNSGTQQGWRPNYLPSFKVRTKVLSTAAGLDELEGQHSKVAPMGMQKRPTLSSKL